MTKILGVSLFAFMFVLQACTPKPKFKVGDCVLPPDGSSPDKIFKISAVTPQEYRVNSYSLVSGKLVQSKNEVIKAKAELEGGYFVIDCPKTVN